MKACVRTLTVAEVDAQLQDRDIMLRTLTDCLFTAQQRMTKFVNEKRKDV